MEAVIEEVVPVKIASRTIADEGPSWFSKYDYIAFYERILGRKLIEKKFPWFQTNCPFHNDTEPSYFINAISGTGHCFSCGVNKYPHDFVVMKDKFGETVINFLGEVNSPEERKRLFEFAQAEQLRKEPDELFMAMENVTALNAHDFLFRQPFAMQILQRDRGLTEETIRKFKIGFMRGTPTIPIYDIAGNLSSLKFHKKYQTDGAKNQLYPWSSVLDYSPLIVLVEGEFDALITIQNGFSATTQVSGANTWDNSFNKYFRKKMVVIAYDNDSAGEEGALKVGKALWKDRCNVRILKWPDFMKPKEDHVDFFVKYKQTAKNYENLLKNSVSILNL